MAKKALKVGDTAPDFEALSDSDKKIKLSDFRGQRVVLYFYPKDSTPGCTTQACGFRDSYPTVEKRKAVVLGVSPDGVASHQKFKSKQNLPFKPTSKYGSPQARSTDSRCSRRRSSA